MSEQQNGTGADVWARLAAPLPTGAIQWRIDGKPTQRDGKYVARFVAYIDAQFVRERLDSVVPGQWDETLDLLPPQTLSGGEVSDEPIAFKCRLQVLGVIREAIGTGRDYKSADSDALKRAAVRYGIGSELYGYGQNWVQVDGDGKYAKPVEDPNVAYARRQGQPAPAAPVASMPAGTAAMLAEAERASAHYTRDAGNLGAPSHTAAPASATASGGAPSCPICSGPMWDDRLTKRNPSAPDFKCRNKPKVKGGPGCEGVIWPPKANGKGGAKQPVSIGAMPFDDDGDLSEVPF